MKSAYLDHASATPVRKKVFEAMLPYFSDQFANPSNVYDIGSKMRQVVEEQRAKVAEMQSYLASTVHVNHAHKMRGSR